MKNTLALAACLALFILSIYTVRYFDRESYTNRAKEITCDDGKVLFLDFRRDFVCIVGEPPIPVKS